MVYTRTPFKLHAFINTMLPTQNHLKESVKKRNQAMNWLLEQFPLAFNLGNRKPLKESILNDIEATALPERPQKSALIAALRYYTEWGSYLNALKKGAKRIDLQGREVSLVDQAAEDHAQALLNNAQQKFS